jgi:hypothetical protein
MFHKKNVFIKDYLVVLSIVIFQAGKLLKKQGMNICDDVNFLDQKANKED